MVAMTVLMPLLECFDRWDGPGLKNDTELPVFLVTLLLSLVVLVAVAISRRAMARQTAQTETAIVYEQVWTEFSSWTDMSGVAFTAASPPLRI